MYNRKQMLRNNSCLLGGGVILPPKFKFTKEQILSATLELVRKEGRDAVTARKVAEALHASSKVIFGIFDSMEELQNALVLAAQRHFDAFTDRLLREGRYPPYKAVGMAYIRYAAEERELFRLLYMRDRSAERAALQDDEKAVQVLMENYRISENQARNMQLHMWFYVHGIASLIATDYFPIDEEKTSQLLTEHFNANIKYFQEENLCL